MSALPRCWVLTDHAATFTGMPLAVSMLNLEQSKACDSIPAGLCCLHSGNFQGHYQEFAAAAA
jgi:hypothetical protein